jgi:hypothetical protein
MQAALWISRLVMAMGWLGGWRDVATIGGMSTFSTHADIPITDIHHGDPRVLLRQLFDVAVQRALPLHNMAAHLPVPPKGRTVVIGAGKAGGAMAQAVEALWPTDAALSGLVVTRYHPQAVRTTVVGPIGCRDHVVFREGHRTRVRAVDPVVPGVNPPVTSG